MHQVDLASQAIEAWSVGSLEQDRGARDGILPGGLVLERRANNLLAELLGQRDADILAARRVDSSIEAVLIQRHDAEHRILIVETNDR